MRVNDAIVEKFVDSNIQMGKLLAVHDEKLDKQDRIDGVLFEKIEHLHNDLHQHAASIISFVVSPLGQRVVGAFLTPSSQEVIIPGSN